MKILFFADLHASMKHGLYGISFVDQIEKTLDWIVEMAKLHDVDYVVFLGDVFHVQQAVDTPSLFVVARGFERIQRAANCRLVVIEGNHDVFLKEGEWSSTEILRHIRQDVNTEPIILVSKQESVPLHDGTVMQCVAYTQKGYTPDPAAHFIAGHLEVSGSMYRPGGLVEEHGVSPNFETFQVKEPGQFPICYVGGHYHHPQIVGRSLIAGACCYHSFQDQVVQTPRGSLLLTLDRPRTPTLADFVWIENPHATPVHTVRVATHAEAEQEIAQLQDWCQIPINQWNLRVVIPTAEAEHVKAPEGANLSIIPDDPPKVVARTQITSQSSPSDALNEYMQQVPPAKLGDRIWTVGRKILTDLEKAQ